MTSKHKKIEHGCNTLAEVAAAYEVAAGVLDTHGDSAATEALGAHVCCDGHMCGCRGADVGAYLQHLIRALTPADAKAALNRMIAEAEARGMREAAEIAEKQKEVFLSPEYAGRFPTNSFAERFACTEVYNAILAASKKGGV